MLDERYLTTVSGLSDQKRRELVRYYAQLDEERRVYAHWQQRTVFKHLLADGRATPGKGARPIMSPCYLPLKLCGTMNNEVRLAITAPLIGNRVHASPVNSSCVMHLKNGLWMH